jgi:hypothetical protein
VAAQLGLFAAATHPALDALRSVDINTLTPLDALRLLSTLAESARRPS